MGRAWLIEADFMYRGYRCVCVGNNMGHRCGYVGIPRGHKYYGEDYDDIPIYCHGGLTYGSHNPNYPVANNEGLYWIGFDCAHYGDAKDPELLKIFGQQNNPYLSDLFSDLFSDGAVRTQEMVEGELRGIVNQLYLLQNE